MAQWAGRDLPGWDAHQHRVSLHPLASHPHPDSGGAPRVRGGEIVGSESLGLSPRWERGNENQSLREMQRVGLWVQTMPLGSGAHIDMGSGRALSPPFPVLPGQTPGHSTATRGAWRAQGTSEAPWRGAKHEGPSGRVGPCLGLLSNDSGRSWGQGKALAPCWWPRVLVVWQCELPVSSWG